MDDNQKLTVMVTAEDIAAPCHFPRSGNCPIARAINRELLPGMYTVVDRMEVRVFDSGRQYTANEGSEVLCLPLPSQASVFVRKFDAGWSVEPFTFEL